MDMEVFSVLSLCCEETLPWDEILTYGSTELLE